MSGSKPGYCEVARLRRVESWRRGGVVVSWGPIGFGCEDRPTLLNAMPWDNAGPTEPPYDYLKGRIV